MLSKREYNEIAKDMKLKVYQRFDRLDIRLRFFEQFIPLLEGKDVIEFGCNAGFYGYEVAKVANSYLGVDPSDRYIPQALVTKRFIKKFNTNVDFVKRRVKGWIRDQQKAIDSGREPYPFNAMYASFALYHFSDKEVDLIRDYVLPKCDIVIIQNRTKKRTDRKRGKEWRKHNKYRFEKTANVVKWLKEAGFECEVHWGPEKKFCDVIGRRTKAIDTPVSDDGNAKEMNPVLLQKFDVDTEGMPNGSIVVETNEGLTQEEEDADQGQD